MSCLLPPSSFVIPSLHDGAQLECRLFHPLPGQQSSEYPKKKAAIVAHPYVPLGGCFDDPVVCAVTDELLKGGYVVGTFNLRGAGKSEGRTSWTAKAELADYVSFYGFMMHYMQKICESANDGPRETEGACLFRTENRNGLTLILCGYSFGSMLASFLPSAAQVLQVLASKHQGSAAMGIKQTAAKMSAKLNISFSEVYQPKTENNGDPSPPSVIYLLISPLLPPMSLFVTMSFLTPNKRLSTRVDGTFVTGLQPREALTSHRCLAIYGDNDSFTSVKRLRIWSQELSSIPGSLFKTLEIPGAGHFWRESGAEGAMRNAIQEYIQTHLL